MMHERDPASGLRFANPIAKRTAKLRHWAGLHSRAPNLALLSHETLQADPQRVVVELAEATGLQPAAEFQRVWSYKGNGNRAFEPTRYDPLTAEDADWIAAQLDPAAETAFGLPATLRRSDDTAVAA